MSWKENLGVKDEFVFNSQIDEYFKKCGFYDSTMNPRFFEGEYYKLNHDAPVLRFDGNWDWDGGGTQRVFMNQKEIYVERQTSYRSFDGCSYYVFEQPPTSIEEIEEVLNQVVRQYERY